MLLTEYNEAEVLAGFRQEGLEEGRAEGLAEGRAEGRDSSTREHLASVMASLNVSAERALAVLGIPEDEWPRYLDS